MGHSGEGTASYSLCTKQSDNEDTQVDSGGVVPISERDQGSMNEFEDITSGTVKWFVEMRRRYSDTIHLFILAVPQQLRGQHFKHFEGYGIHVTFRGQYSVCFLHCYHGITSGRGILSAWSFCETIWPCLG